jgi:hypothetical protein
MFEEILLEKLASHFDEEDLELLAKEAAEEEAAGELSDEDAAILAEYLGGEETAALVEEVEAEKTAAAYYEMGQVMAQGFQDELSKEAAPLMLPAGRSIAAKGSQFASDISRLLAKLKAGGSTAVGAVKKSLGEAAQTVRGVAGGAHKMEGAGPEVLRKRLERVRSAAKTTVGVGGVGGAGYVAGRYKGKEKKSSDAQVYQALAVLAEAGLLEE